MRRPTFRLCSMWSPHTAVQPDAWRCCRWLRNIMITPPVPCRRCTFCLVFNHTVPDARHNLLLPSGGVRRSAVGGAVRCGAITLGGPEFSSCSRILHPHHCQCRYRHDAHAISLEECCRMKLLPKRRLPGGVTSFGPTDLGPVIPLSACYPVALQEYK